MRVSTLRIAWRNLGRNRKRTCLALGAIALGQLTLVFVNGMLAGSFHNMLHTVTGPMAGHVQIHHPDWREERAVDLYIDHIDEVRTELKGRPSVKAAYPRIFAPVLIARGESSDTPADAEPAIITGVDPAMESGRGGMLEAMVGRDSPGRGAVFIGRALANRIGVRENEQVAVLGQDVDGFPVSELYTVSAIMDSNVELVRTMGIVMSLEDAGALLSMPDRAHELVVQGEDFQEARKLAAELSSLPSLAGMEVIAWQEALPEIVTVVAMKQWVDIIFIGIVFVAAAAGIANTAMMSTFERTREFGMLLAVGSRPDRVVGMVVAESVLLGLAGVLAGSILGTALVLITGYTGINYAALGGNHAQEIAYAGVSFSYTIHPRFELGYMLNGVAAVTLTSVVASLWPAMLVARLEPVEALRA